MIVDSHAHLVTADPAYPPAPLRGDLDPAALADPMTADRMLSTMDTLGVSHAVAVQRAHIFGYDNRYVVDSARRFAPRMAAVCVLDATRPDAADTLARWADAGAVAARFTAPDGSPRGGTPGTGWFTGPPATRVWALASDRGLSLCLHLYAWNRAESLHALAPMMRRFPDVPVVVDHVASVQVDRPPPYPGAEELLSLVDLPRLYVKVTTLNFAQQLRQGQDPATLVEWLVATFGPDRVLWGSDITQTPVPYPEMVALARRSVARLPAPDADAVLRRTALTLYFPHP